MTAVWWVMFWGLWSLTGACWFVSIPVDALLRRSVVTKSCCLIAGGPIVWAALLAALVWMTS